MCADCHSTDLRKNFDLNTNSYKTSWSEINVSCEACHGPGSHHVAWARGTSTAGTIYDEKKGLTVLLGDRSGGHWVIDPDSGMPIRAGPPTASLQIDVCAYCHSRRYPIATAFSYGKALLDSEQPSLLDADLYQSDGQILNEVYEYGSFLQSLMGRKGVLCGDCHDSHSLQLRAPGNAVCGQCHLPGKFDTEAHSHHPMGSTAAQCSSCHMPTRTYMVVDARHDHSIRIPRPDLSIALGTPNACNSCHTDRSAQWAADAIANWYGPTYRQKPHYGMVLDAGRKHLPGAATSLGALAIDKAEPGIVRATALSILSSFAGSITPEMALTYLDALKDEDPLIRGAAINALDPFAPQQRLPFVAPLLGDEIRSVRIAAARSLASIPATVLAPQQRADLDRARDELVAAEMASSDRPEAHLSLGAFYAESGQTAKAEAAYRQALALNPRFTPALINLADLYRQLDRDADAEPLLRQALVIDPEDSAAHEALGLLSVRRGRMPDALTHLQRANALAPADSRYAYVYAVALNSAGRPAEALEVLKQADQAGPADFNVLLALSVMSRDLGDRDAALAFARRLAQMAPGNQDVQALLNSLGGP
jgi:tetratricopeptide (TPR) repeat protein